MAELYIQDKTFDKEDYTLQPFEKGEYDTCTFSKCNLSGSNLSGSMFTDCTFINCNLSLIKTGMTVFRDIQFSSCKMQGIRFDTCSPFGLSFTFNDCQLTYSSFYKNSIKQTVFKNCLLQETDFTESDLTGAVLENCDCTGAIFENTVLEKADLRTAYNYTINPEINKLKKARFSFPAVAALLDKYGIEIENV